MKLLLTVTLASALAGPLCGARAAAPPLPQGMVAVTSVEGISEYALPNGLHILLLEDASKPTTTVNLTVKVGSRYEGYGETGMAHLLEHLSFKGTTHHPSSIMPELSQRGLRFNANTGNDRTIYFASMAENPANLEWYLRWLADDLVNATILRRDLDSEMTVVRNEMERGENDPETVLLHLVLGSAFQWHHYGKVTIGARSDVENVDITQLQAFYHRYYQPDNAVLTVTGKFDRAAVLSLIASAFGPIPKPARVLTPTYTLEPVQEGERSVRLYRAGDNPSILVAYHIVAGSDPRFADALLASSILGGPTLRLNHALVENNLAAEAGGGAWSMTEPGVALFEAELKSDQSLGAAHDALIATVEGVARQPFTAEELTRAKNIWLRGFEQTMNEPEHLAIALSDYIALGDWRLLFVERDDIKGATLDAVNDFAQRFFVESNRTEGEFIPTPDSVRAPATGDVDIAARLKDFKGASSSATDAGETFDTAPQNIADRTEIGKLANDMRYALLPKKTRGGKVDVRIALHFGDEKSLKDRDIAGEALTSVLPRGTRELTREQLAARFEALQTSWSVDGGSEGVVVSLETTRAHLAETLVLISQVLREPRFDPAQFAEMKNAWIAEFEAQRSDPSSLVGERLARIGNPYPKGDVRYAPTLEESLAGVRALTLDEVRAFYHDLYGASSATITAVGDFDPASLKAMLEKQYGDWKSPTLWQRVPRPYLAVPGQEFSIDLKDKQNALLMGGRDVPLRDTDREYQALRIATHIFGGGGASRLWERVRQHDGLSYDVGAALTGGQFDANASWEISAIFAPQNLSKVRSAIADEMARALKDGFGADEVQRAKDAIDEQVRLSRAQDRGLAGLLALLVERDQTPLYLSQIQGVRDSLTVDEVNAAFRKYVHAGDLVLGVAGDLSKTGTGH